MLLGFLSVVWGGWWLWYCARTTHQRAVTQCPRAAAVVQQRHRHREARGVRARLFCTCTPDSTSHLCGARRSPQLVMTGGLLRRCRVRGFASASYCRACWQGTCLHLRTVRCLLVSCAWLQRATASYQSPPAPPPPSQLPPPKSLPPLPPSAASCALARSSASSLPRV